jgi:glycosyltransferase involved in cell wall biosynthesis
MHKKGIKGNLVYYFGGDLPTENESKGKLSTFFSKVMFRYMKQFYKLSLTRKEYELYRSFRKEKIDLVITEYGTTAARVLKVCKKNNLPLIPIFHGFDIHMKEVVAKNLQEYQQLFLYAKKVIAVSHHMAQKLVNIGCPEDKIIVTPCAPNAEFLKIKPSFETKNLISVGRFVEKKAPHLTIKAFSKILNTHPKAKLYMIGDGELLEMCKELIETLKLENNVVLMGIRSSEEIIHQLEQSVVYIQHSVTAKNGDSEGTPVSVLEAQAASLPVVATRHAGIQDVVLDAETGILVAEHDVEAMTEGILFLLNHPEKMKEMGMKGRKRIIDQYSEEIHLTTINEAIYS